MHTAIVDEPIDVSALLQRVAAPANGAILLFVGTVRDINDGRRVSGMEYSAYRGMAARELADIAREASERVGSSDIAIEHRLGTLELGAASVAIAVAHPHRGPAYDASRFVIEQLKRRVPIWKLEHYEDGTRKWVGSSDGHQAPVASATDGADQLAKDAR